MNERKCCQTYPHEISSSCNSELHCSFGGYLLSILFITKNNWNRCVDNVICRVHERFIKIHEGHLYSDLWYSATLSRHRSLSSHNFSDISRSLIWTVFNREELFKTTSRASVKIVALDYDMIYRSPRYLPTTQDSNFGIDNDCSKNDDIWPTLKIEGGIGIGIYPYPPPNQFCFLFLARKHGGFIGLHFEVRDHNCQLIHKNTPVYRKNNGTYVVS